MIFVALLSCNSAQRVRGSRVEVKPRPEKYAVNLRRDSCFVSEVPNDSVEIDMLFLFLKDAHAAAIRVRGPFGRHVGISLKLIQHVLYCGVELRVAPVDH